MVNLISRAQPVQLNIQSVITTVNDLLNNEEIPSINKILEVICQFSNSDRAYFFKHFDAPSGDHYCTQLFEYCIPGVTPQIDNPLLQHFSYSALGMEWLYEDLANGLTVSRTLSDLSPDEWEILKAQNIKSVLITPVFMNQKLWGFIGFDDCSVERNWHYEYEITLICVGTMMANFIAKIESQKALALKNEFYKSILESSFEGIIVMQADKTIIYQSAANEKVLGYTNEEFRDLDMFSLFHPDDLPQALLVFQQILEHQRELITAELRYKHKSGNYQFLEMSVINLTDKTEVGGIIVNFRDVTEKRNYQEALKHNKTHLEDAQALGKIGSWQVDFTTGHSEWSDEVYRAYGIEPGDMEEPSLEAFYPFIHPEDRDRIRMKIEDSAKALENVNFDFRVLRPTGETRYIHSKAKYIFDLTGRPVGIFGTQQDVTEIKLFEFALIKSEEKYRHLFEFSPLPMWVYDFDSLKFIEVNNAAVEEYGYSKEEFLQMTLNDIRPQEDVVKFEKMMEALRNNHDYARDRYRHVKKNGEIIFVDVRGNEIRNENGKNYRLVVSENITERMKHIELIESLNQKLSEIAWIQSHVIRAPLASLMGLVQIVKDEKISTEPKMFDYIMDSANKLDEVIRDIVKKSCEVEAKVAIMKDQNQLKI